jgi:hypothetical protein
MCGDYGDYLAQNLKAIKEAPFKSAEEVRSGSASLEVFQSDGSFDKVAAGGRRRRAVEEEGPKGGTPSYTRWG